MELPQLSEFSEEKLRSKLFIHPQDASPAVLEFFR
jgi:hypothetical protein